MTAEVEFFDRLAAQAGTARIADDEVTAVLDLARIVAHGTERRFAPLAAYAVGLGLPADTRPAERAEHVRNVIAAVQRLVDDG